MLWQVMVTTIMLLFPTISRAGDLYVDHEQGNDENTGRSKAIHKKDGPFKTVNRAMDACKPGDTIHLAKTDMPYHQSIEIRDGLSGSANQPIIIDGHGATLNGCTMVDPKEWIDVGNGLYRSPTILADIFPRHQPVNESLLWRFFFVFNGEIQRMGRSGKGDHPPLPKPADLKPGDWTFDQASGAFYVKIDPSQKLADARIEYPDLINGFKTSDGQCQYIVVRNLTVTRFHNDGFNINGATQNCRFENVQAIECGDDGMSAHTQSRLVVDGFVSRGNSTGICHVQGACSVSRNIELRDNHGFDVLLTGWGTHEIDQCVIRPSAEPLRVIRLSSEGAESGQRCGLVMENVRIDADQAAAALKSVKKPGSDHQLTVEVLGACDLTMRNSILSSVSIATRWPGGGVASVKLFDSTIGGKSPTKIDLLADTKWEANRNAYRIDSINVFGKQYEPAQLEVYRKASGQDSKSTWARD